MAMSWLKFFTKIIIDWFDNNEWQKWTSTSAIVSNAMQGKISIQIFGILFPVFNDLYQFSSGF